jgi:hypothetical protein
MDKNNIVQSMLDCLNEALKQDHKAVQKILEYRIPCSKDIADNKDIVVQENKESKIFTLGALGIINGMLNAADLPKICVCWDDMNDEFGRPRILKFSLFEEKTL